MDTKRMQEQILYMSGVNPAHCMQCGKCSASCPAYEEMAYHPHQFAAMIARGEIEPLIQSDSLHRCMSCFACSERCPRGVQPAKLIEAVRQLAIRKQGGSHLTPDDIPALLDADMPQQLLVSALRKYHK